MANQAQDPHKRLISLRALIEDIPTAILTTVDDGGSFKSRPMQTLEMDEHGHLWFFTDVHSAKVAELESDHRVNLAYYDPTDAVFVSVSGIARVVRDEKRAEELWQEDQRKWFPQGARDPSLVMLRIHIDRAECWDHDTGKMDELVPLLREPEAA